MSAGREEAQKHIEKLRKKNLCVGCPLIHFMLLVSFYTQWKHQLKPQITENQMVTERKKISLTSRHFLEHCYCLLLIKHALIGFSTTCEGKQLNHNDIALNPISLCVCVCVCVCVCGAEFEK